MTIAASAVMLLAACDNASISFESVIFDKTFALAEGLQDSLTVTMDIEYPVLPDNDRSKAIANAITCTLFGNGYSGLTPSEAAAVWADSLAADYRGSNLELLEMLENQETKGRIWG